MAEMSSQEEAAPKDDFVHLHVHTDYSMLDGAGKIKDYIAEAKRLGQPALAITDHGYMFGAYEFYAAATAAGIKPIIGVEAYMTPGTSRFDKTRVFWGDESQRSDDVSARGSYTHMTLLSRNDEGLHNLMRMDSLASLEGQWGKAPRIDRELLSRYSSGLIGSTGCPSSEVQTRLRLGQWDEARRAAGELQDIFGREFFYVELMDHGLEIERRVTRDLLRLADELGAPLLATNDSHYVRPGQDGAAAYFRSLADAGLSQVPGLRQGADVAQRPPVERPVSAEGRAAAHIHGPGRADAAGGVEDAAPAWPLSRCAHDDVVGQSVKKRVVDLPGL